MSDRAAANDASRKYNRLMLGWVGEDSGILTDRHISDLIYVLPLASPPTRPEPQQASAIASDVAKRPSIVPSNNFNQDYVHRRTFIHKRTVELAYATHRDGFSLLTLYSKLATYPDNAPVLLVIKDNHHQIFGAFLSHSIKESRRFYGSSETFLFTWFDRFEHFPSSGQNNFYMAGESETFTIGSGDGAPGLWIDGNIDHGRTGECLTFNNRQLTRTPDFRIIDLEVWSFVRPATEGRLMDEYEKAQRQSHDEDDADSAIFASCRMTSMLYRW